MQADCIEMLKLVLQKEEERAWQIFMEAKLLISRLDDDYGNQRVKSSAAQYWRAARDAEESLTKNRQCKYALEVPYQLKHNMYEHMIDCLKSLKEKETQYRDAI